MSLLIITLAMSILLAFILIPILRKTAHFFGLMDAPTSDRKIHKKPVPVVGGLAIGLTFIPVFLLVQSLSGTFNFQIFMIVALFALLLALGVLDDRFDIPAKQKFLVQIISAILIVKSGIYLETLNLLFNNVLPLWFLQAFTVLVIVGVVNAYNLIDGIDGLAGGMLLFGFFFLLFAAIYLQNFSIVLLSITAIGTLSTFLYFNLSKTKKIFMGDGGTLSYGFLLVVSAIWLFEKSNFLYYGMNVWSIGMIGVLFIPVLDTLVVFTRRVNHWHSPFRADRKHLHHLMVNLLGSHVKSTVLIIMISILLFGSSVLLFHFGHLFMALFFPPSLFLLLFIVFQKIELFKSSQAIIQNLEKLRTE